MFRDLLVTIDRITETLPQNEYPSDRIDEIMKGLEDDGYFISLDGDLLRFQDVCNGPVVEEPYLEIEGKVIESVQQVTRARNRPIQADLMMGE